MSAFDDISKAVEGLSPVRPDYERVILIGHSAWRSLAATDACGGIPEGKLSNDFDGQRLLGIFLRDTLEFPGWAIREIGPPGIWEDAR